jgi:type I restriction enzyme S subunit
LQYVFGYSEVLLSDVAEYAKERIASELVDEKTYVSVENLLQDKQGKRNAANVPNGNLARYVCGDVLLGNIRPYLRKIWLADLEGGTNGDVLIIRGYRDIIKPKFLYYILSSEEFFIYDNNNAKGAKMPRGNKDVIMGYSFYVPSLEEQERIVAIIDRFDTLCNDLSTGLPAEIEVRQKQYEYYRDKLLTFKEQ